MISTSLYLDKRSTRAGDLAQIYIVIRQLRTSAMIGTGIKVREDQWSNNKIINNANADLLNTLLDTKKLDVDRAILKLSLASTPLMTASQVKDAVLEMTDPTYKKKVPQKDLFLTRFRQYADSRSTEGTRSIYYQTIKRMEAFDPKISEKSFEEVDRHWLQDFEDDLARTHTKNARNIFLRNIRAVFNDAIDDDVTSFYPFRKFKIRPEATRKRSLTVDQLRALINYECDDWQREYVDIFLLCVLLRGINMVDLARVTRIVDGRIDYSRAKTHKLYSVKVEPEAMAIIEKYRGKKALLSISDRYKDYKDYLHHMNAALKKVGTHVVPGLRSTGKPMFPDLSQYWCRHTWATLAAELEIPKETIAHGLGHGSETVTDIYIDFNEKKIDEANRKIIDYIFNK